MFERIVTNNDDQADKAIEHQHMPFRDQGFYFERVQEIRQLCKNEELVKTFDVLSELAEYLKDNSTDLEEDKKLWGEFSQLHLGELDDTWNETNDPLYQAYQTDVDDEVKRIANEMVKFHALYQRFSVEYFAKVKARELSWQQDVAEQDLSKNEKIRAEITGCRRDFVHQSIPEILSNLLPKGVGPEEFEEWCQSDFQSVQSVQSSLDELIGDSWHLGSDTEEYLKTRLHQYVLLRFVEGKDPESVEKTNSRFDKLDETSVSNNPEGLHFAYSPDNGQKIPQNGLKLHIWADLSSLDMLSILTIVRDLCQQYGARYKVIIPKVANQNYADNMRPKCITIYPPEDDGRTDEPKNLSKTFEIAKAIDDMLAGSHKRTTSEPALTDRGLGESNRLSLRYGEYLVRSQDNTSTDPAPDQTWEDSRERSFSENLPDTVKLEELKQKAVANGIPLHD